MTFHETKNYFWQTSECLGYGASGVVYKCRHKVSGNLFAVKTTKNNTGLQSSKIQCREFDVLLKLNHENIVRLICIEEELNHLGDVIIMELCTGHSLHQILNEPEHFHGLPDQELILMIANVAAGLEHLRLKEIVHRDIKPGNIMRTWDQEGCPIYKLTDFGAARELKASENFESLCGTEEYLHPDMYERAVLHHVHSDNQHYSACVDLWSMGVTIYHAASGQLPFQPFGGTRGCRLQHEVMFHMTSKKRFGIISGIQRSPNGPVEWCETLPITARLSHGLAKEITPLLAGSIECSVSKQWQFDHFFDAAKDLRRRRAARVFYLPAASIHTLYLIEWNVAELLQVLASIVASPAQNLVLFAPNSAADSAYLSSDAKLPVQSASQLFFVANLHTVSPVELISSTVLDHLNIEAPVAMSLDEDARFMRSCLAALHRLVHLVAEAELSQLAFNEAALNGVLHSAIQRSISATRHEALQMQTACTAVIARTTDLLRLVPSSLFQTDMEAMRREVDEMQINVKKTFDCILKYHSLLVNEDELAAKWQRLPLCRHGGEEAVHSCNVSCLDAVKRKCVAAQEAYDSFCQVIKSNICEAGCDRDRSNYYINLLRRHEKQAVYDMWCWARDKFVNCCFARTCRLQQQYVEWFKTAHSVHIKVLKLNEFVRILVEKQQEVQLLCNELRFAHLQYKKLGRAIHDEERRVAQETVDLQKQLRILYETCAFARLAMDKNCAVLGDLHRTFGSVD